MGARYHHHSGTAEYWKAKAVEYDDRIRELEQELARTGQYLAMAEGQENGGPPGWTKDKDGYAADNSWTYAGGEQWLVTVARSNPHTGWYWEVWHSDDGWNDSFEIGSGKVPTAREAVIAATAAYQEACDVG